MADMNCKSYETLNGVDVYRMKNSFKVKKIVPVQMLSYLFLFSLHVMIPYFQITMMFKTSKKLGL